MTAQEDETETPSVIRKKDTVSGWSERYLNIRALNITTVFRPRFVLGKTVFDLRLGLGKTVKSRRLPMEARLGGCRFRILKLKLGLERTVEGFCGLWTKQAE